MRFDYFVAKRYLRAKRKGLFAMITTLIGVAGVALGVAALLTTLSVMNGFQQDIQQKIIGAQSHIIVFGQMSRSTYNDFREKIERMPSVAAVAPMVYGQAIVSFRDRSMGIIVRGLDPDQEKGVSSLHKSITEGSWNARPRAGEKTPPPPIVLGEELAKSLGIWTGDDVVLISPKSIATGLGIMPTMKKFRVSGLIKTGYYEFDNTIGYMKLDNAADFLKLDGSMTGMEVRLTDIELAQKTAKKITGIMGFPYVVKTFAQMNQTLYAALKLEKFVMFLILALIVLVAALNIASNLILLSTEKLRDIGIMRAMGATPSDIRRIFWWEGFLIATTGIVCGLLLGFGLCWVITTFNIVELPADVYYLTKVPVAIKLTDVLAIVLGSYLLCFVATFYPATKSSRVSPVDAIRYG